jgi:hypothetical protein
MIDEPAMVIDVVPPSPLPPAPLSAKPPKPLAPTLSVAPGAMLTVEPLMMLAVAVPPPVALPPLPPPKAEPPVFCATMIVVPVRLSVALSTVRVARRRPIPR